MKQHSENELASFKTVKDVLSLVFLVTFLSGFVSILASIAIFHLLKEKRLDLYWSAFLGFGVNLISASGLTLFIERAALNAKRIAEKELSDFLKVEISETLEQKIISEIRNNLRAIENFNKKIEDKFDSIGVGISEVARSGSSQQIKKNVFDGGIYGAFSVWSSRIDRKFLESQKELDIFLKDGKTFFEEAIDILQARAQQHKTTRILLLHPDYAHMEALASMDLNKSGHPNIQRSDCWGSIAAMQKMRSSLLGQNVDCADCITFIGYHGIPTWVGFIGEEKAYIHLYFSRPYRGNLNTLFLKSNQHQNEEKSWFHEYRRDFREMMRLSRNRSPCDGEASIDLWDYKLPDSYTSKL